MTTTRPGGPAGPASSGEQASLAPRRPSSDAPLPADPRLARELLDGLAEAVVTTDHAGIVTLVNATAGGLLPELTPGTDLARCAVAALASAVRRGAETFDAEHRGRRLRGVCRRLAAGRCAWYVRDVTEEQARADALLAERSRTAFLAQAGSRLGLSLHRDQALRATATLPVPYLADAALVVHHPPPAAARPHWIRYAEGDPAPVTGIGSMELTGSVPGLAEALDGGTTEPSPCLDAERAELAAVLPDSFGRPGAVLISPMPGAGGPGGALILVRRAERPGFDQRDVELAREFAARAGASLAAAQLYGEQAHLARVLQHSLLPPELPPLPGLALAGGYRAAGDSLRIGGDFYDVFRIERGGMFALGDVCGRGVGAAVLTGRVRQSLQTLRLVEQRPVELMRLLNRALFDAPDAARRAQVTTLLLGTAEPAADGGARVRVAGGGHPAPLLVRADGTTTPVRVGGMPIGAFTTATFAEAEVRLAPGELLLAYTDGVTEARGGPTAMEMFGERRLREVLASAAGLPPSAVVDRLLQVVDDWLDGQSHDDIAMLAVCAAPPA
ncbi:PP2C family protein-serine/threonine phosphatase [Micromonospora purpureochromogenes]|uniref:Serine phosphatase RsbU (Regulator of sigma subunit) n=1 Tax=Micromonospora purpureochromogenes TaxID=47872 RepID=A0ABX2RIB0_9ACTN|nr:PP2C family protein-serine/threonine phosphatase [Micromonospora purpureochromogenes]NYF54864.1 serine phosphatase RsbU (regulator of sigma subunit) [Micromonospora purpureochromogenes]